MFVARLRMLDQTRAFVEAFAARNQLADADALRLQLIIEELFTNTVTHGYGRECDEPIEITLGTSPDRVTMLYEDAARPYDPVAALPASQAHLADPVGQRPVGQLGVQLVAGLADDFRYSRVGERNRLQLVLRTAR